MDNRAVTPVIGVIIMIALVVVMAAIVMLLSGGYSDDAQTVPKINGQVDDHPDALTAGTSDNLVTLEHRGGDDCIESADLEFRARSQTDGTTYVLASDVGDYFCVSDTITLSEDGTNVPAGGYTIYVVFKPQQFISFQSGVTIS